MPRFKYTMIRDTPSTYPRRSRLTQTENPVSALIARMRSSSITVHLRTRLESVTAETRLMLAHFPDLIILVITRMHCDHSAGLVS